MHHQPIITGFVWVLRCSTYIDAIAAMLCTLFGLPVGYNTRHSLYLYIGIVVGALALGCCISWIGLERAHYTLTARMHVWGVVLQ